MREYKKRYFAADVAVAPVSQPEPAVPGYRLTELIDQFLLEGVVPDFIPADLGTDDDTEFDLDTGLWTVDPRGNIRTDPMDIREQELLAGVDSTIQRIGTLPPPDNSSDSSFGGDSGDGSEE